MNRTDLNSLRPSPVNPNVNLEAELMARQVIALEAIAAALTSAPPPERPSNGIPPHLMEAAASRRAAIRASEHRADLPA